MKKERKFSDKVMTFFVDVALAWGVGYHLLGAPGWGAWLIFIGLRIQSTLYFDRP